VGLNYLIGCADYFGDSIATDEMRMLQKFAEYVFWNQQVIEMKIPKAQRTAKYGCG
jgi:hypothetical protein